MNSTLHGFTPYLTVLLADQELRHCNIIIGMRNNPVLLIGKSPDCHPVVWLSVPPLDVNGQTADAVVANEPTQEGFRVDTHNRAHTSVYYNDSVILMVNHKDDDTAKITWLNLREVVSTPV